MASLRFGLDLRSSVLHQIGDLVAALATHRRLEMQLLFGAIFFLFGTAGTLQAQFRTGDWQDDALPAVFSQPHPGKIGLRPINLLGSLWDDGIVNRQIAPGRLQSPNVRLMNEASDSRLVIWGAALGLSIGAVGGFGVGYLIENLVNDEGPAVSSITIGTTLLGAATGVILGSGLGWVVDRAGD